MQKEKQDARRQQIRAAAYELLEKKGYKATSMLAIAKQAKASNETLYSWYGNKQSLFRTLIEENASEVAASLEQAFHQRADIESTLTGTGELLLEVVTSNKAVALNRAAAADASESGILGETLASAGRGTIAPLLNRLFDQARNGGQLHFKAADNIVEVYLGLLIGDVQIRRATGVLAPLSKAEVRKRSAIATKLTLKLFAE